MRILLVTEASSGGTGRHVADLTHGLRARGHEVALVYSPRRLDPLFRQFLEQIDSATTLCLPMHRGLHPSDLRVAVALRRFIEQVGPFDIVHAHSSKAGALVRASGSFGAAAVLYTPHGVFTMNPTNGRLARRVAAFLERRLARRSQAVIAVSADERTHMATLGVPDEKLHLVPNGIAQPAWPTREQARAALGLRADELITGFVGRLEKEKGPLLLIEAFARAAHRCPAARLAIVGEGPLFAACRDLVAERGMTDRVRLLGYRPALEALPAFDVMVIPSLFESMPYVLLEALSAGVPVLATPVAGMRNTISDGQNGFLVPPEADALATALVRILHDQPLRLAMSAQATATAREFTSEHMVERTLEVYRAARARRAAAIRPRVGSASEPAEGRSC